VCLLALSALFLSQITLPKARVKRVMKADDAVKNIKPEAVIMVAKATELFVELLSEQAYRNAVVDKRKGVSYKVRGGLCTSTLLLPACCLSLPLPALPVSRFKWAGVPAGPRRNRQGRGTLRLSDRYHSSTTISRNRGAAGH
jgi:hypothetical protein